MLKNLWEQWEQNCSLYCKIATLIPAPLYDSAASR